MALKVKINHLKTIKIKIWAKMVPKSKSCQIYLEICTPVIEICLFLSKLDPSLKLQQISLKTCTQEIWKVLNADLTWTSYDILFKI